MKHTFTITINSIKSISTLPNSWVISDFKQLLELMEYEDIKSLSDPEMEEMCLLLLADLEPNESAEIVLRYVFKEQFNDGQYENLSHEIIDDLAWETYSDMSTHEDFFNIGQLLFKAYNGKFKNPSALLFEVTFAASKSESLSLLENDTAAMIIRLLSQGMPPNTLLKRLLKEELDGANFQDAEHILWQLEAINTTDLSSTFRVLSSKRWFDDIKYVKDFTGILEDEA
jgi:hypothetical protein